MLGEWRVRAGEAEGLAAATNGEVRDGSQRDKRRLHCAPVEHDARLGPVNAARRGTPGYARTRVHHGASCLSERPHAGESPCTAGPPAKATWLDVGPLFVHLECLVGRPSPCLCCTRRRRRAAQHRFCEISECMRTRLPGLAGLHPVGTARPGATRARGALSRRPHRMRCLSVSLDTQPRTPQTTPPIRRPAPEQRQPRRLLTWAVDWTRALVSLSHR